MDRTNISFSNKKVAVVTHRSLMPCIPGDDLRKFLLKNGCHQILYITHPLTLLKESYQLTSQYEIYKNTKLIQKKQAIHWVLPESCLMIKDFFYTIYWTLKTNQVYDIYFGMNNLNALAGLILKKIGRVKKVVYYTIDLYPVRFENRIVNWLYHGIDSLCVKFSDETWNVSPFLEIYRNKEGKTQTDSRQITVPIGIWFNEMKRVPWGKVNKNKIVYVGHLKEFYGVDLAIRALPKVIKKMPNIELEIIGGGEQLKELQQLAKDLQVSSHIIFHGWKGKKESEKIMQNAALGIAPFNTDILDEKVKNADPAKIKDYLALGLPVIMTDASLNASDIKKSKCGIIIDFSPESMATAVIKLLSHEKLLKEYKKSALLYVQQYDWNIIFLKNIRRLL